MKDFVELNDLSELCTKDLQNEGKWFQVEINGEKWNVEVLVYGKDSDVVQEFERGIAKQRLRNLTADSKKDMKLDDELVETLISGTQETLLRSFGGIRKFSSKEPLRFNGNEIPMKKDESCEHLYKAILEGSPDIADFIAEKMKERELFLPSRKEN